MATFHLVRHGQADYDLAEERRLVGGMRDLVPLTALGRRQAAQAAERLVTLPLQAIVASPMTRAMETAQVISLSLGLPVSVEFDLHEWLPDLSCSFDTREFAALQSEDLRLHQGEWPRGQQRPWEPLSLVRRRVRSVLAKYDHLEQAAVVVHGMVIYALTGREVATGEIVAYCLGSEDKCSVKTESTAVRGV